MKGHIEKPGQRSYRLTVELPRGEDGRRRQHRETVRGTKRTAQARMADLVSRVPRRQSLSRPG